MYKVILKKILEEEWWVMQHINSVNVKQSFYSGKTFISIFISILLGFKPNA